MRANDDRFTMDVLREAFIAVADEMFVSLQRTSQSPVIYEVLDFAVGVTDTAGELVSQGNGIAGFLGPLGEAVRAAMLRVPGLRPGDVVATNDPYAGGGTHLSDVALVRPVFAGEDLVGFAAAKGHWTEVGGKDPGSWTADSRDGCGGCGRRRSSCMANKIGSYRCSTSTILSGCCQMRHTRSSPASDTCCLPRRSTRCWTS